VSVRKPHNAAAPRSTQTAQIVALAPALEHTGGFPLLLNCWAGSTSPDEGTTAPHQTCDHHW